MRTEFPAQAMLLVANKGKLLVNRVVSLKYKKFVVRPPGGHVEFGELSSATIKREMREELKTGIKDLRFLGVLENIFRYKGKLSHGFVFAYSGKLDRKSIYSNKATRIVDKNAVFNVFWAPIKSIRQGKYVLVPKGLNEFLSKVS